MTNIKPRVYKMSQTEGTYAFIHQDGYLISIIEGTIKEIAYACFKSHINHHPDGYGGFSSNDDYGPFWVETVDEKTPIVCSFFATIEPYPEPAFWEEVNTQFKRFLNLKAFS